MYKANIIQDDVWSGQEITEIVVKRLKLDLEFLLVPTGALGMTMFVRLSFCLKDSRQF